MQDFFTALVKYGQATVLQTVTTMAEKLDLQALDAFIDYLAAQGHDLDWNEINRPVACAIDTSRSQEGDTGITTPMSMNLTGAIVHAIAPRYSYMPDPEEQFSTGPQMRLLAKFLELFTLPRDRGPFRASMRPRVLETMLHQAAGASNDVRIVEAILKVGSVGATADRSWVLSLRGEARSSIQTLPLTEALIAHRLATAACLLSKKTSTYSHQILSDWLRACTTYGGAPGPGDTIAAHFRCHPFTRSVLSVAREGRLADVSALLKQFDRIHDEAKLPGTCDLRMKLLSAYLSKCRTESNTPWDFAVVQTLAGPDGLDPQRSKITANLREWLDNEPDHQRWDNRLNGDDETGYVHEEAELVSWAIRAHCAPLLAVCAPALVAALSPDAGEAPRVIDALRFGDPVEEPAWFDVLRFKDSVDLLLSVGHDLNASRGVGVKGRTTLHALAWHNTTVVTQALPVLLELGAQPDLQDEDGMTARELAGQDVTGEIWSEIERATTAHRTAMNIIYGSSTRTQPSW